jgi:3-hydroxybutyryl-CoA dehydrogenase
MTVPKTIAVVGAGTMGNGIAHVAARSGLSVILHDLQPGALDRAMVSIRNNLDREVSKGSVAEADKGPILARIAPASDPALLSGADFMIEAVVEDFAVKAIVFETLDRIARPGVILASNTSSISITRIGSRTARPGNVIGMHFMNPVPVMALVEIVRGAVTTEETYATTRRLAEIMGKTPVPVNDYPGFVSNRVLMPMINEAIFCVMEGVAEPESIDTVMKLGMNHPMGPLALADLIGLDVCLQILEVLHQELGDPKYRPCPLLRKMVDAGRLGRKVRKGFYEY